MIPEWCYFVLGIYFFLFMFTGAYAHDEKGYESEEAWCYGMLWPFLWIRYIFRVLSHMSKTIKKVWNE